MAQISNTKYDGSRKLRLFIPQKLQPEHGFTSKTDYFQEPLGLSMSKSTKNHNCGSYSNDSSVPQQMASGLQLTVKRELPSPTAMVWIPCGSDSVENHGVASGSQTIIKQESPISSDSNTQLDLFRPESIDNQEHRKRSADTTVTHVEQIVKKEPLENDVPGPSNSNSSNKTFTFRKKVTSLPARYEILRDKIGDEVDLEIGYNVNMARLKRVECTPKKQARRDCSLSSRVNRAFQGYLRNTLEVELKKAQQSLQENIDELKSQLESLSSTVPESSNAQVQDILVRCFSTIVENAVKKLETQEPMQ